MNTRAQRGGARQRRLRRRVAVLGLQDSGSGWGVVGQRFDAAGNKLGGEFVVNETTAGSQYQPRSPPCPSGGFVVTSTTTTTTSAGRHTADVHPSADTTPPAMHRRPAQAQVPDNGTATSPPSPDLGGGNFAVVCTQLRHQRQRRQQHPRSASSSSATAPLARSGARWATSPAPSPSSRTTWNRPAGPRRPVGLTDPDSGNFNGGRLDLYYVQGGRCRDQLSASSGGNGPGQIGVSGQHHQLRRGRHRHRPGAPTAATCIDFTSTAATVGPSRASSSASATAAPTPAHRQPDPRPARRRRRQRLQHARTLTVNITPSLDGTPLAHTEERVNTHTAPGMALPQPP